MLGLLKGAGGSAVLASMAVIQALAACVCPPGVRSTDPILQHALLAEAAALGRPLFALFSHPARAPLLINATIDMLSGAHPYVDRSDCKSVENMLSRKMSKAVCFSVPHLCLVHAGQSSACCGVNMKDTRRQYLHGLHRKWPPSRDAHACNWVMMPDNAGSGHVEHERLKFWAPAGSVLDGTALVMQAIAEGGPSAAAPMREAALAEGAILLHLCLAISPKVLPIPHIAHVFCFTLPIA